MFQGNQFQLVTRRVQISGYREYQQIEVFHFKMLFLKTKISIQIRWLTFCCCRQMPVIMMIDIFHMIVNANFSVNLLNHGRTKSHKIIFADLCIIDTMVFQKLFRLCTLNEKISINQSIAHSNSMIWRVI